MIEQEDIPYTKEEREAMVKHIQHLRKDKRELLDRVYDWIKCNAYKYGKIKFINNMAIFEPRTDAFIKDLKKYMEEQ